MGISQLVGVSAILAVTSLGMAESMAVVAYIRLTCNELDLCESKPERWMHFQDTGKMHG